MKREIKFRIWDAAPAKDGFEGLMIDMDYTMKSEYLKSALKGEYPIMQFTGLKDKKGVDIYEGDIVEVRGTKRNGIYQTQVIWNKFGWELKENKTYLNDNAALRAITIVIGNIYENPDLLTL